MYLIKSQKRKNNLKHFIFELIQECNQNCIFCYNVWKHHEYPGGILSLDGWKQIVLKLKNETKLNLISISGGEPLLYPDVLELIDFIKNEKIKINFLTNGSLIDEKTAERLTKNKISLFEIPLVSHNKSTHHRLKGTNDFNKVVEGIANIKNFNGRIITTFVATKYNINDLEETVEFAIALGSMGLMFNRINPGCKEQIELMPTLDQLNNALEFLNDFSKEYQYPVSCSIPIQPCLNDIEKNYQNLSFGYCPSGDERSYYTIDSVGNVRICNHTPAILGNILKDSFSEITNNDFVDYFRQVMPNDCISCVYSQKCRGGCKAAAQVCFGKLEENDPFFEGNKKSRGVL